MGRQRITCPTCHGEGRRYGPGCTKGVTMGPICGTCDGDGWIWEKTPDPPRARAESTSSSSSSDSSRSRDDDGYVTVYNRDGAPRKVPASEVDEDKRGGGFNSDGWW